ncbi:MAG: [protein-PII] uridylyltransferase [Alphaproteobacteria bacterium]|nr:[protein-PII] uridylyltransferase [Alphaproteobacteria bacterium]
MEKPHEKLRERRAIVNRKALIAALAAVAADTGDLASNRSPVLAALKQAMDAGRAEILRRFELDGDGRHVTLGTAHLTDQIVKVLFDFANQHVFPTPNPTAAEQICLVAVGGYGRGELYPQSDLDLLFLRPYKQTPRGEQVVEYMLYTLWDLRLKVGHATRTIDESMRLAQADHTIRTALLESRYLWGVPELYHAFKRAFAQAFLSGDGRDFLEAKLAERDVRHRKMGDSRYVVEPNVKDGKGGLRDLQTLYWIAKYLYRVSTVAELVDKGVLMPEEARKFDRAETFLRTVRCHIHFLTGRAEERLSFDLQGEIGRRMHYTDHAGTRGVERFMKHYYLHAKTVGDLTRIFCAALDEAHKRKPRFGMFKLASLRPKHIDGFVVDGARLKLAQEGDFARDPVKLLRLFHVAQENALDIHPATLRLVTQNLRLIDHSLRANPEANRLFMAIMTSKHDPETALRRMNESGVFGRFVPDFGRVVAQTQHDMYHTYTVDEHTIRAIGILSRIERGELKEDHPLASDIVHKVISREVLYLSVLLHDIAKGRGGDHSVLGADVANHLGPRLGLSPQETETVAWLVRYHLAMSYTGFQRDLQDPKTIQDFAALVQSPERLRLLLVLTVCDIRAVGPNVWNGWKAALLRQIYYAAEEVLSGGTLSGGRTERVRQAQEETAKLLPDWNAEERERILGYGYPAYWLSFDPATHARHADLMRRSARDRSPLMVEHKVDPVRAITEVTIYTQDSPGLFWRIAGAMALTGANIVDAKIFTMSNGMALDTFAIQDTEGGAFERPDKLARLSARIEQALSGQLRIADQLAQQKPNYPTRANVFTVAPRVLVDNNASNTHTVVEINGRDRPGFLYLVTRTLSQLNLQISSAHVTTYGERAVDVFYVKDLFGLKIVHEGKLAEIKTKLEGVLQEADRKEGLAETPPTGPTRLPRRTRTAAE